MNLRFPLIRVLALVLVGFAIIPVFAQNEPNARKKLVGTWRGGWPDDKQPQYEIVFTAEKITSKNLKGGEAMGEGTYKLDPKAKTLDATGTSGKEYKGKTFLGIYSLDGDKLKWCSNNGTKNRPKDLVNKPGNDHYLLILERKKS